MSQPDAAAEPVLVEHRSDKVSVVTLNRPERLNASNAAMTQRYSKRWPSPTSNRTRVSSPPARTVPSARGAT